MTDLVDGAVVALAQLVERVHLVQRNVEAVARLELYTLAVEYGLALELERSRLLVNELGVTVHCRLLLFWLCGSVIAVGALVHL